MSAATGWAHLRGRRRHVTAAKRPQVGPPGSALQGLGRPSWGRDTDEFRCEEGGWGAGYGERADPLSHERGYGRGAESRDRKPSVPQPRGHGILAAVATGWAHLRGRRRHVTAAKRPQVGPPGSALQRSGGTFVGAGSESSPFDLAQGGRAWPRRNQDAGDTMNQIPLSGNGSRPCACPTRRGWGGASAFAA